MRTCLKCNRVYLDETLRFCRVDGSELISATSESETIRISDAGQSAATITSRLITVPSIAVLPFVNMNADAESEYFCDGLAEELLNALSKIDSLKVAARTSAFSFKGKNKNVSEIGNTLGVRTVLEGSVRKSGNRLRITVQLVNSADGYHLWSERYDREMKDVFDVQDEITLAVVKALKVKLMGEEKAVVLKRYTDNTEAYELYLKGRFASEEHLRPESQQKGIDYFERAIEIDPSYAPAYSGLADCYSSIGWMRAGSPQKLFTRATTAAMKAIEIDDRLAEAYVSLGYIHFLYDWKWKQAENELKRAIEILPSYAPAHIRLAIVLSALGRTDEAIAESQVARELDPLAPNAMLAMGFSLYFARDYDKAITEASNVIKIHSHFYPAHLVRGWSYEAQGRFADAADAFQFIREIQEYPLVMAQLGHAYARVGRLSEARAILEELNRIAQYLYVSPYEIATIYIGLDEKDQAFSWLERACKERAGWLVFLKRMARYDSLRSDPRFSELVKRVGLDVAG